MTYFTTQSTSRQCCQSRLFRPRATTRKSRLSRLAHPGSERFGSTVHLIPSSTVTRTAFALQTTPKVNEPELIARVLAGDRLAGRELYDAHAPRVFRLAYRLTGDAELAREFTQDTFVRAFHRLADFRGDAAFSTWIHRITVTVVDFSPCLSNSFLIAA